MVARSFAIDPLARLCTVTERTEGPAVDARSGHQVRRWIESRWPASRSELTESGNSYLLHVWAGGLCLVLERRGDEWGFTADLAADEPGFDSGHPLVSGDGVLVLRLMGHTLDRVSGS